MRRLTNRYPANKAGCFWALFLSLCLSLPAPAFALRVQNGGLEERTKTVGELENALGHGNKLVAPNVTSAGVEERQKRLVEFRSAIQSKQADLSKQFETMSQDSGEYQDRQRAIQRIDRLSQVAENLLNFPGTPDLFDRYMTELAEPLIRFDNGNVRTLNFILASYFGEALKSLRRLVTLEISKVLVEQELDFILNILNRNLDSGRAGFDQFFYLPHLPIVVEAKELSQSNRQKLEEAARLIFASGWGKKRPESLKLTSSIIPLESADLPYVGVTSLASGTHSALEIAHQSPRRIAATLIHEDAHLVSASRYKDIALDFELLSTIPKLKHPWLREPDDPSVLLWELAAHGVDIEFQLNLWNTLGFEPPRDSEELGDLLVDMLEAQRALQLLQKWKTNEHLNGNGEEWLEALEELWQGLSLQTRDRVDKEIMTLVFSGNRLHGYLLTALAWKLFPERRGGYAAPFRLAMLYEKNLEILTFLNEKHKGIFFPKSFRTVVRERIQRLSPPPGTSSNAGVEESVREEVRLNSTARLAILDQAKAYLRDLSQAGVTIQVLDPEMLRQYPALAVLTEISDSILVDRGEETLRELRSRDTIWVDYYGLAVNAARFDEKVSGITVMIHEPGDESFVQFLTRLLHAMAPLKLASQAETEQLAAQLLQLAA